MSTAARLLISLSDINLDTHILDVVNVASEATASLTARQRALCLARGGAKITFGKGRKTGLEWYLLIEFRP